MSQPNSSERSGLEGAQSFLLLLQNHLCNGKSWLSELLLLLLGINIVVGMEAMVFYYFWFCHTKMDEIVESDHHSKKFDFFFDTFRLFRLRNPWSLGDCEESRLEIML